MENDIFESKTYKKARKAYIGQCTFEYLISILVSDAFLAKLLTEVGISDSMIGIISSIITLAFLFQIAAFFAIQRITNVKKFALIFSTASQLLFAGLYLIPFLAVDTRTKTILIVLSVLFAYFANYFVTSMIFKWANSFVKATKRGTYSAGKEMVSLFCGIVFSLSMGAIIDRFESIGNLRGGFLFVANAMLVLNVANFISLTMIKHEEITDKPPKVPFSVVIKNVFGNRNFVNIIILTVLWDVARYTTIGFMGVYKTKELLYTVGTVQLINMVANFARLVFSMPFGRFSDKHTFAGGLELAFTLMSAAFLANVFCTPGTRWLVIVYTILSSVSNAGTNQNLINITYSYVDKDYFVQASAIKNSIGGICGFGASILASRLLSHIQQNGNMLFGMHVYGQQVLSAISLVLMAVIMLFVHFVIRKQKVLIQ